MFKFVHLLGHLLLRAAGDVEGKVAGLGDLVEHEPLLAVHDVAVAPVALAELVFTAALREQTVGCTLVSTGRRWSSGGWFRLCYTVIIAGSAHWPFAAIHASGEITLYELIIVQ